MRNLLLSLVILAVALQTSSKENLKLTSSQKQKLDKFRNAVSPKLTHDWMKQDLILVRYLRARNWDTRRAAGTIMETVKWWKDFGMDRIHKEDFSAYEKEFPIHIDGVDIYGQPLFVFNFGEWDVRKAALQGRIKGLIRWLFKRREEVVAKARDLQRQGKTNGTQWSFILNLDNFNQNQHLCSQCLQVYTEWTATLETHYPGSADKIILINAPSVFEVVMTLVRPLFSQSTKDALQVLSSNKAQWAPILFKEIKRDQLPETFGGTKVY